MTEARETFGRPITGDIQETSREVVEQRDPAEFIAALDKLFEDDRVLAYRWGQYTPYFNDGEACELSVSEYDIAVKIKGLEDFEDGDSYGSEGFVVLEESYNYDRVLGHVYYAEIDGVETKTILDAASEVPADMSHSVWLRQTFGDHARVTATREGFDVEYYEHE